DFPTHGGDPPMLSKALARFLLGRAAARIAAGLVLPVLSLFPLAGRAAAEKPKQTPPHVIVEQAELPVKAGEAQPAPEIPGSPKPPEAGGSTPPSLPSNPPIVYPPYAVSGLDLTGWKKADQVPSCGASNVTGSAPSSPPPPEPSLAHQVNALRQTCASQ